MLARPKRPINQYVPQVVQQIWLADDAQIVLPPHVNRPHLYVLVRMRILILINMNSGLPLIAPSPPRRLIVWLVVETRQLDPQGVVSLHLA